MPFHPGCGRDRAYRATATTPDGLTIEVEGEDYDRVRRALDAAVAAVRPVDRPMSVVEADMRAALANDLRRAVNRRGLGLQSVFGPGAGV